MQYDGVRTHGPLHRARMRNVVFRRSHMMFQAVITIVTAVLGERQKTGENIRRLMEIMFPGQEKTRLEREGRMADELARESSRVYAVHEAKIKDD